MDYINYKFVVEKNEDFPRRVHWIRVHLWFLQNGWDLWWSDCWGKISNGCYPGWWSWHWMWKCIRRNRRIRRRSWKFSWKGQWLSRCLPLSRNLIWQGWFHFIFQGIYEENSCLSWRKKTWKSRTFQGWRKRLLQMGTYQFWWTILLHWTELWCWKPHRHVLL